MQGCFWNWCHLHLTLWCSQVRAEWEFCPQGAVFHSSSVLYERGSTPLHSPSQPLHISFQRQLPLPYSSNTEGKTEWKKAGHQTTCWLVSWPSLFKAGRVSLCPVLLNFPYYTNHIPDLTKCVVRSVLFLLCSHRTGFIQAAIAKESVSQANVRSVTTKKDFLKVLDFIHF